MRTPRMGQLEQLCTEGYQLKPHRHHAHQCPRRAFSRPGLCILSAIHVWGQRILFGLGAVLCTVARLAPPWPLPTLTVAPRNDDNQNVSRHDQYPLGGQNHPQLRTMGLYYQSVTWWSSIKNPTCFKVGVMFKIQMVQKGRD